MKYCLPGNLIRDLVLQVFVGAGQVCSLHLACTRILDFQKESRCSHKPYCFYKQFGYNEPFLRLGWWETFQTPSSQVPTKGQFCLRITVRSAMLTCSCTSFKLELIQKSINSRMEECINKFLYINTMEY